MKNNQMMRMSDDSKKIFPIFWLLDTSGSMRNERIQSLNYLMQTMKTAIEEISDSNPSAIFCFRAMTFSDGAEWLDSRLIPLSTYKCKELTANGLTATGAAFDLLRQSMSAMDKYRSFSFAPAIILITDGRATDNAEERLEELLADKLGAGAIRLAVSIGADADRQFLERFAGADRVFEISDNIRGGMIDHLVLKTVQAVSLQLNNGMRTKV